ncbi:MAG: hypothetical protein R3B40_07130 [Polyangiales bacterium]
MSRPPRMRPTFELPLGVRGPSQDAVLDGLRVVMSRDPAGIGGVVFRRTAVLWLTRERRRFYSPCLHVHFGSRPDGERTLLGRFAPHPNVWTGFMAGYGVLSMVALLSIVYAYVQWSLGHTPWAALGFPAALALMGFEYGAAFIGQGLGAEQMYTLRRLLDEVLEGGERGTASDAPSPPPTNAP